LPHRRKEGFVQADFGGSTPPLNAEVQQGRPKLHGQSATGQNRSGVRSEEIANAEAAVTQAEVTPGRSYPLARHITLRDHPQELDIQLTQPAPT
jgi:hypothetical protein